MGTGIYFFESDKKQAEYYAKAKKIMKPRIIEVKIESETLNLVDTETYELFSEYAKRLENRYKKRKDGKLRK